MFKGHEFFNSLKSSSDFWIFESIPVPALKIFKGTDRLSVFLFGGSYYLKVFEIEAQLDSICFLDESS